MDWLILLLVGCVGYLIGKGNDARYKISESERKTAEIIASQINPTNEVLINNVTLRLLDGRTTQIDHILISRYGVYAIETKDYSGWIFGNDKAETWTQVIYKRKSTFQNPLRQNYYHTKALEELFDFLPKGAIKSIVIFTDKSEFKTEMPDNVINSQDIPKFLSSRNEELISLNRIQFCLGRLTFYRLPESYDTDRMHVHNLRNRI
ncbi:nuclease-related domain-containing protein [Plesiomonas shigelloides]|uniref:nuclease-related domain-containing protein n=1 Tax=Plesiomonas shigelloides TaxID=703 RepID=UPI00387EF41C